MKHSPKGEILCPVIMPIVPVLNQAKNTGFGKVAITTIGVELQNLLQDLILIIEW